MQELQREVTILIVTHNMGQAMRISSRSMFMYLGELVEYGDTETMFSNPHRRAHPSLSDGQDGVIEDHSSHLYVYTIFMLDFVHHESAFQRTEILDGAQYVEDKLLIIFHIGSMYFQQVVETS